MTKFCEPFPALTAAVARTLLGIPQQLYLLRRLGAGSEAIHLNKKVREETLFVVKLFMLILMFPFTSIFLVIVMKIKTTVDAGICIQPGLFS